MVRRDQTGEAPEVGVAVCRAKKPSSLVRCSPALCGFAIRPNPSRYRPKKNSTLVLGLARFWIKLRMCVYSSEDGAWGELTYIHHVPELVDWAPCSLVGNALYIMFFMSITVLKYDVTTRKINVIELPCKIITHPRNLVLMATDKGNLGFARVEDFRLHLWSRQAGRVTEAGWAEIGVVELKTLLPMHARSSSPYVVRFMDGIQVIFVRMDRNLFSIDLKSGQVRKVHEGRLLPDHFVPNMSFRKGVICNLRDGDEGKTFIDRYVPTSSSCPPRADRRRFALDARRGRVLLYNTRAP
ncbi:hypothetical protein EJB05_14073, partial [Eragrostis curvula]